MGSKHHWNQYYSTWISSLIRASSSSRNISSWNIWIESNYRGQVCLLLSNTLRTLQYIPLHITFDRVCVCVCVCVHASALARVPNIGSCYTPLLAIGMVGSSQPANQSLCTFQVLTKPVPFLQCPKIDLLNWNWLFFLFLISVWCVFSMSWLRTKHVLLRSSGFWRRFLSSLVPTSALSTFFLTKGVCVCACVFVCVCLFVCVCVRLQRSRAFST